MDDMAIASFTRIDTALLNICLDDWGHKIGPLRRPMAKPVCHGLWRGRDLLAVTAASSLIAPEVAAGITRRNTVELSRLCAVRPSLCRVALRLWRELWLPYTDYDYAISYQDEVLHNGNTYRFDGWTALRRSHSGPDRRGGRPGRTKTVWVWRNAKRQEGIDQ